MDGWMDTAGEVRFGLIWSESDPTKKFTQMAKRDISAQSTTASTTNQAGKKNSTNYLGSFVTNCRYTHIKNKIPL
ncbi:hypothetical protein EYC84_004606 [Monilinia fructicola]|uniref:Uncharacterized protein n=1 Tax=Monilinia fructicola TaxID=38448 RepID=A0A5M9K0X6_MONFR|nr:hypothetical protein EYC84_004606 [Monilinia fructicola]